MAKASRDAIINGKLNVNDRLPSKAELAEEAGASRPRVREALERQAAQSLIRTQRGAFEGAFIDQISYKQSSNQ